VRCPLGRWNQVKGRREGTCRFWIGKIKFQVHAWGVPAVNRALISETQLTDHGARISFTGGGNHIETGGPHGARVSIGKDAIFEVRVAVDQARDARVGAAVAAVAAAAEAATMAQRAVVASETAARLADAAVAQAALDSPWEAGN
jgi:hypothetical protein